MKNALLGTTAGTPIEVWFQDEARVGQKGSLTYVWAPIGSCPLMVRDNRHDSAYLFGAICPARAVGAAIVMPAANAEAMNEHLTEISTQVASGPTLSWSATEPAGIRPAGDCVYRTISRYFPCRLTHRN